MFSNFNIAGLTNEELEVLISERCAALGTVKRVAICDSFPIVNYKLAFIAMSTPDELAKVIKEVGATSIGDAAVIRLDMERTPRSSKSADVAAICVAAFAGCAALYGLFVAMEYGRADAAYVQVFSKLELGQSRKDVEGRAAASKLAVDIHSPATQPNRVVFAGSCCTPLFNATRYDLVADYDGDDRLLGARLLKTGSAFGGDTCSMLFEIPSRADMTFPGACAAEVRKP